MKAMIVFLLAATASAYAADEDSAQFRVRDAKGVTYRPLSALFDGSVDRTLGQLPDLALLAATGRSYPKPEPDSFEPDVTGSYCPGGSLTQSNWRRLPEYSNDRYRAPSRQRRIQISGIGYNLWRHRSEVGRPRYALVFRGTDLREFGDAYSNARWFTRINPFTWDQYGQTRDLMEKLTGELDAKHGIDGYELIAVGHSLGGGLAQHAAYSSPRVREVFAFATSPVTAVTSIDPRVDRRFRVGLKIFRIYESGEVLALLRRAARQVLPLREADPKVVELRFDFRDTLRLPRRGDGPLGEHSIRQFACDLLCYSIHKRDRTSCKVPIPSDDQRGVRTPAVVGNRLR